jgi:hypothetical protein
VLCGLGIALLSEDGAQLLFGPIMPTTIGLAFYGIAAFNAWRVHRPSFAQRPRSLVPWLDKGEGTYLSPL